MLKRARHLMLAGGASCLAMLTIIPAQPADASSGMLKARAADGLIICAHRSWTSPEQSENSLRTMPATQAAGPFMLEMDLAVDHDASIVMMHDTTIDRTTDGHGAVSATTNAELSRTHLRRGDGVLTSEAPPHFSEILSWARQSPAPLLMLDIKRTPPGLVMQAVRSSAMTARVLLLTFDPATARSAFASDPDVMVSVLEKSSADFAVYAALADKRQYAVYIPHDSDPSLFRDARLAGHVVVTDVLAPTALTDAVRPDAIPALLASRPASILVTNHPLEISHAVKARRS